MITLVILAVLAAIAVPSMREFIARKRVEGVANELAIDLRYLRSEHIGRGGWTEPQLAIRFSASADMSCYVMYERSSARGADCDCGSLPVCPQVLSPSKELKTVTLPVGQGVQVTAIGSPHLRLTGTSGLPVDDAGLTIEVSSTLGGKVLVQTNLLALPLMCSKSGHHSGLAACP